MLEIFAIINSIKGTDNSKNIIPILSNKSQEISNMFLGFGFVVIKYRYLKTKEEPASGSLVVIKMQSQIIGN